MGARAAALALYVAWTLATWLLEGRPRTLLRPDAVGMRLAYDAVANLGIGILAGGLLVARLLHGSGATADLAGFRAPRRAALTGLAGAVVGLGAYVVADPPSLAPVVMLNAFARVFATSAAEIVVCWSLLGTAIVTTVPASRPRLARVVAAAVASALFGVYHVAHSPPFDEPRMVVLLTGVGVVTSAVFVLSRDVWGTLGFHNGLAMIGVVRALHEAGRLDAYATVQPLTIATAAAATALLVLTHRRAVLSSRRASCATPRARS